MNKIGIILALILIICCLICYIIIVIRDRKNKENISDCYRCSHYKLIHAGDTGTTNIYRCTKLNRIDYNKFSKSHKYLNCKDYKKGGSIFE